MSLTGKGCIWKCIIVFVKHPYAWLEFDMTCLFGFNSVRATLERNANPRCMIIIHASLEGIQHFSQNVWLIKQMSWNSKESPNSAELFIHF